MWTLEDLEALNNAIKQGVKEVYYGDKRVVYRSLSEMLQVRALIMSDLGIKKDGRKYASTKKGL